MDIQHEVAKKQVNDSADFGNVFEASERKLVATRGATDSTQIHSFLANRMASMVETFDMLQSSPEAHKFADFFEDCRRKAEAGEPAYVALFSKQLSKLA